MRVGDADTTKRIAVTIHLKTPCKEGQECEDPSESTSRPTSRSVLAAENMIKHAPAAEIFQTFANRHRLLVRPDLARRCVHLEGTVAQMAEIFGTSLSIYCDGHSRFRARSGFLFIPDEIAPWMRAVLGFDQRPLMKRRLASLAIDSDGLGMWPTQIATLYGIPAQMDAKGECVGIIAIGGGYQPPDVDLASTGMNRPSPLIIPFSVDGVTNNYTGVGTADEEVALDIQTLAGLIPSARIVVYFTANSEQGLADAIQQALWDGTNGPHVLSISWGITEKSLTDSGRDTIQSVLATAGSFGVTVVAAAGDGLATAQLTDGAAHVLFPASSGYVIACGGTQLALAPDGTNLENDESVWNKGLTGSDGGISDLFQIPEYQLNVALPPSFNSGRKGRGVPDVAAAASQDPGYRIVLNGKEVVKCGTSAATPLWAALIAMANAKRGRPLGSIHSFLYQNPLLCREITEGNNQCNGIGYYAGPGWNACTGLGVPKGLDTINGLAAMP